MLQFLVTLQTLVADRIDRRDDKGATAVEYGLMVALIAAVIIAAVSTLGLSINKAFGAINTVLPD